MELQPSSVGSKFCRACRLGKPTNGNSTLLEENELVRAVSQHMFDLSEKSISTFINDHGREMSRRGSRFDFRTICDPACQAMGSHQPARALASIPPHRQGKVRQASPHFSYAGNLI